MQELLGRMEGSVYLWELHFEDLTCLLALQGTLDTLFASDTCLLLCASSSNHHLLLATDLRLCFVSIKSAA